MTYATDPWGISSPDFLNLYIFAGMGAFLITFVALLVTVNRRTRALPIDLSPTEIGMLVDDRRAIATALTTLRAHELVDRRGVQRELSDTEAATLEPLTRAVYEHYRTPGAKVIRRLQSNAKPALAELKDRLIKEKLMSGPQTRARLRWGCAPLLAVIGIGLVRICTDLGHGVPVAGLMVLTVILGLFAAVCLRAPRRTRSGTDALTDAKANHTYLDPSNKPALAAYGATRAGLAAALFGGAALWALDPAFAAASAVSQEIDQSTYTGGSVGSGCGGSGGGCGGGCGGGGCGGGS